MTAAKPSATLDAYLLHGAGPGHRPALHAAERVSLLAIGSAALTAPLVVLSDLTGDLPPLCEAIDEALALAAETVKAAKARFELRAGMALEMIREEGLYGEKGFADFLSYVTSRWGYSLSRAYQLIDMVLVTGAVSTIVESPLPESQVRLLAVVVRQHGADAARKILTTANATPGQLTAKKLAAVRDQLGLTPTSRGGSTTNGSATGTSEVIDAEVVEEPAEVQRVRDGLAELAKAAQLLTAKNLTAAVQHDAALAQAVLAGYENAGEVRRRLRRHTGTPAAE
ncbi:hypothetical protein [Kitasatospora terrestris]|uniref:Uncharacterized protein n=1 Tax=Kitasatospora terrestris TaxID=258051 RepID=A0ABP9DAD5_9ACTN